LFFYRQKSIFNKVSKIILGLIVLRKSLWLVFHQKGYKLFTELNKILNIICSEFFHINMETVSLIKIKIIVKLYFRYYASQGIEAVEDNILESSNNFTC